MLSRGGVALTGLMGAGKSAAGRRLAEALGWGFVDLDAEVEALSGESPGALLGGGGEVTFRAWERRALEATLSRHQGGEVVIALGGGTWHQEGVPERLRAFGETLFLDAPLAVLERRLQGEARSSRPLLGRAGGLSALSQARRAGYLRADRVVDADGSPAQVAARSLEALGESNRAGISSVRVELGARSYPIWLVPGEVEQAASLLRLWLEARGALGETIFVVTDARVGGLYLGRFVEALSGLSVRAAVIPEGEGSKSLEQLSALWDALLGSRLGRRGVVVALGGGVVGDLAGFAAATALRGLSWVQIPTTVLAQVDSAVGGKTGINHGEGKNLLGCFHQPAAVIAPLGVLRTLEARQRRSGLAEVIKYGVLQGEPLLRSVEEGAAALVEAPWTQQALLARCCGFKARVVGRDEQEEQGARALLNLGHTFGHAMEALGGYGALTHGEAVGLGMLLAARASASLGLAQEPLEGRLRALLEAVGLPTDVAPWLERAEAMAEAMGADKKRAGASLRLVLPVRPGDVRLHAVAMEEVPALLRALASCGVKS